MSPARRGARALKRCRRTRKVSSGNLTDAAHSFMISACDVGDLFSEEGAFVSMTRDTGSPTQKGCLVPGNVPRVRRRGEVEDVIQILPKGFQYSFGRWPSSSEVASVRTRPVDDAWPNFSLRKIHSTRSCSRGADNRWAGYICSSAGGPGFAHHVPLVELILGYV